jgi:predicted lipoprotein with Yx(FWY)xxD motif
MTTPKHLHDRPLSARRLVAACALALSLVALTLGFSSPAKADSTSCAESVTSAPTGPATVSAETKSPFGKVLVVGSGTYAGCSLYLLTSDQLHALSGGATPYGCSDNANDLGAPCDTVLWPALLTKGAPIAGPGINPTLLGTVTRTDITGLPAVQQVTYAGQPLYRFIFDESSDEIEGANLFDPVTSPPGTWFLVDPSRGLPATGTAQLQLETAPVNGSGPDETVLAATMSNDFTTLFPPGGAPFPVYTLSTDRGHQSACQGACSAANWQPVLTSGRAQAGPGVDQNAVGIIVRPDGTHQVTYDGKPLYLNFGDAYLAGVPFYNNGMPTINGAGAVTPWGVFNTIPAL